MKLRVYRNSDVIWLKEKPDQEDKTLGKISLQVKKWPVSSQKIHNEMSYTAGQSSETPNCVISPWPGQIYELFHNNTMKYPVHMKTLNEKYTKPELYW